MGVTRRVSGPRPVIDVAGDAARVAEVIADVIRRRVRSGVDIFDRPFVPYAEGYARRNASGVVDLKTEQPGGLLDTLRVTVSRSGERITITVAPSPENARVGTFLHHGTPTMRARPWLGLSPRDLATLQRLLGT